MRESPYELRISNWGSDVCSSDLFGRNGISSIRGDIGHYHAGAFRRETTCRGRTDAARAAGHNRDLALKSFHSISPLSQIRLHACHWAEWAGAIALDQIRVTFSFARSDELRVGQAWVSPCRSRW